MFQTAQVVDIWIVLLSFSSYQVYLQITNRDRSRYEEGLPKVLQWITGIPALLLLAIFMFDPDLPAPELLSLPANINLVGLGLFNMAGLLIVWSHASLGDCWSAELETKADHQLVDTGIYRWVRHPLYSSYVMLTAGLFLLSDNWWVGVAVLVYFLTVASRVWKEEAMMVERLGHRYLTYQQTTGRFFPKFAFRSAPAAKRAGGTGTWDADLNQKRG